MRTRVNSDWTDSGCYRMTRQEVARHYRTRKIVYYTRASAPLRRPLALVCRPCGAASFSALGPHGWRRGLLPAAPPELPLRTTLARIARPVWAEVRTTNSPAPIRPA